MKVCETDVDVTTFDRKIIHIKKEGDYLDMKAVIHPKLWAMVWNRADTFTSKLSITNTPGRVSATIAHDLCSGVVRPSLLADGVKLRGFMVLSYFAGKADT